MKQLFSLEKFILEGKPLDSFIVQSAKSNKRIKRWPDQPM